MFRGLWCVSKPSELLTGHIATSIMNMGCVFFSKWCVNGVYNVSLEGTLVLEVCWIVLYKVCTFSVSKLKPMCMGTNGHVISHRFSKLLVQNICWCLSQIDTVCRNYLSLLATSWIEAWPMTWTPVWTSVGLFTIQTNKQTKKSKPSWTRAKPKQVRRELLCWNVVSLSYQCAEHFYTCICHVCVRMSALQTPLPQGKRELWYSYTNPNKHSLVKPTVHHSWSSSTCTAICRFANGPTE